MSTLPPDVEYPEGIPPGDPVPPPSSVVVGQVADGIDPLTDIDYKAITSVDVASIGREVDGRARIAFVAGVTTQAATEVRQALLEPILVPIVEAVPVPDVGPTQPPAAAPSVVVAGFDDSFLVQATGGDVDQFTTIEYFIDGVLFESTRSSIVTIGSTPDGQIFNADQDYAFHVVARNDVGATGPSATVTAQLRPGVSSETIAAALRAGFVLAGEIQVGQISIHPVDGIVIPLASGGEIRLPADGSDAVVNAILRTSDMIVNGGLAINGVSNFLNGSMSLAAGTPNPSQTPNLAHFTALTSATLNGISGASPSQRGLAVTDDGTRYAITDSPVGETRYLRIIDTATNNVAATVADNYVDFSPVSVTAVGNTFHVLVMRWNPSTSSFQMRLHKYSKTGALEDAYWLLSPAGNRITTTADYQDGAIGYDAAAGRLWVAKLQGTNVKFFQFTTTAATAVSEMTSTGVEGTFITGGFLIGTYDLGAKTFLLTGAFEASGKYAGVGAFTTAGTFASSRSWHTTGSPRGLLWNGTNFVAMVTGSQDTPPSLANYNTATADRSVQARYTYYDTNASNGNKESAPSPAATFTLPARAWLRVSVPAPPSSGSGVDDPNAIRIYTGTSSTVRLAYTETSRKAVTVVVTQVPGTGATPPTSSTFPSTSNLGEIATQQGGVVVRGDGSGSVGTAGFRTSVVEAVRVDSRVARAAIPLASGFQPFSTAEPPFVETIMRWVQLGGSVQRSGGSTDFVANTNHFICDTLPSADRPESNLRFIVGSTTAGVWVELVVFADGRISVRPSGATRTISLNATWPRKV